MTNTDMLERKIVNSGLSISNIAVALGISESDLSQKIRGEREFLVSEIWVVGKMLELDRHEVQQIFLLPL